MLQRMEFELPKGSTYSIGQGKKIIIDSGTSFILMPKSDIEVFMLNLEQQLDLECLSTAAVPICYCSDDQYLNFPDLKFVIDG